MLGCDVMRHCCVALVRVVSVGGWREGGGGGL